MVVLLVPFGWLDVDVSRNFRVVEFSESGLIWKLGVEQVLQLLQHRAWIGKGNTDILKCCLRLRSYWFNDHRDECPCRKALTKNEEKLKSVS